MIRSAPSCWRRGPPSARPRRHRRPRRSCPVRPGRRPRRTSRCPARRTRRAATGSGPASGCPGVATRVPSACGMRAFSAWVPIPACTNSACTHLDWNPARQISQVLSEITNDPTTKSPGLDRLHVGADLLDHADVLVPHQRVVGGFDAAVGPQVRPADAGRGQPDDRIRGLDDPRVLALLDPDISGGVHHDTTHVDSSLLLLAVSWFSRGCRLSGLAVRSTTDGRQRGRMTGRLCQNPPGRYSLERVGCISKRACTTGHRIR